MNKIIKFELDKEKNIQLVLTNDKRENLITKSIVNSTIDAKDIYDLFKGDETDSFTVSENPFKEEDDPHLYKSVNVLKDMLDEIAKEVNKPIEDTLKEDLDNVNKQISEEVRKIEEIE